MVTEKLEEYYNEENNLPEEYANIIKENLRCLMK